MRTLVINLFGAPGSGKSTGAAYIFSRLKMAGVDAELVTEVAKDLVWENNSVAIGNQVYLLGEQSLRISRCYGKVRVIITDSPLLLGILYNKDRDIADSLERLTFDVFKSYENVSYFIVRNKPYNPNGRLQSEEESGEISTEILELLEKHSVSFKSVSGDVSGYEEIVSEIFDLLNLPSMEEHLHRKGVSNVDSVDKTGCL